MLGVLFLGTVIPLPPSLSSCRGWCGWDCGPDGGSSVPASAPGMLWALEKKSTCSDSAIFPPSSGVPCLYAALSMSSSDDFAWAAPYLTSSLPVAISGSFTLRISRRWLVRILRFNRISSGALLGVELVWHVAVSLAQDPTSVQRALSACPFCPVNLTNWRSWLEWKSLNYPCTWRVNKLSIQIYV